MVATIHPANHLGKAIEARPLHRPQWMRLEERDHLLAQLLEAFDAKLSFRSP